MSDTDVKTVPKQKYDGREITKHKVKITNAGDGLSSALEVDEHIFHFGDKVYVLLMCEMSAVGGIDPIGDKEAALTTKLSARAATIMDEAEASKLIEEQQARIDAHEQAKKPVQQDALDVWEQQERDGASANGNTTNGANVAELDKARDAKLAAGAKGDTKEPAAKKTPAKTRTRKTPAKKAGK